jgi:hypothetical protein
MIYMAKQLAEVQGFVPAHFFRQPNKILAAMLYGRDLGITPTNALQHIIVIEGKATADAQLIGMLVRRAGHRLEDTTTDQQSTVKIARSDDGTVHVYTFSMQDAKRAGLLRPGSAWEKYPQAMLYARALTACARKGAQDALMGVAYVPEELGVEVAPDGGFTGEIPTPQASPATVTALKEAERGESVAATAPANPAMPDSQPPSAEVNSGGAEPTSVGVPPAAVAATTSLSGPSVMRRMGRSVGPAPKRVNVVTVEQAATAPVAAPEAAPQPPASAEPVPGQPAPLALTDESILAPPAPDGLAPQRELLRQAAAELAHVNAILRNALEHALKNEPLEPVPPSTPSDLSDQGLGLLIERDYPGRQLSNLGEAELQNRLELVEANLAKKRAIMTERGISEA